LPADTKSFQEGEEEEEEEEKRTSSSIPIPNPRTEPNRKAKEPKN
jgi:hypothetical protein